MFNYKRKKNFLPFISSETILLADADSYNLAKSAYNRDD
jgi:hypothetical protein